MSSNLSIVISVLGLTAVLNLLVVFFILSQRKNRITRFFFSLFFFGVMLWSGAMLITYSLFANDITQNTFTHGSLIYFINHFIFFAPVIILTSQHWFIQSFLDNKLPKSWFAYWPLLFSLAAAVISFTKDALYTSLTFYPEGYVILEMGAWQGLYSLFIIIHYVYTSYLIRKKIKQIKNWVIKQQLRLLFWSYITGIALGTLLNWILPVYFEIYHFNAYGPVIVLIPITFFAYAVTRYHFLDLRLNLQKFLTYATTSLILTLPTYAVFYYCSIISNHPFYLCIFPALIVFLILFLPIRKFFNQLFNLLLYGKKQNYQEKIRFLSDKLSNGKLVLDKALQQILNTLNQTFNLKDCFFMPHWELALIGVNFQDNQILYRTELACRGEQENNLAMQRLAKNMAKRKIAILAPIKQNGKYSGALALQDKNQDNELFSSEELNSIRDLANKTVVFLNNLAKQYKEKEYFCQFQHFFRTPLSIACARLNMIMERFKQDAQTYEELKLVEQNLNKVVRFSTNFINFMSIDWSAEFFKEPTSLKQALKEAFNKIPSALAERDQKFEPKISLKGKTDLTVLGSPGTLSAVLSELIVNALIFDSGEAEIAVITSRKFQTATIIISNVGKLTKKEIQTALTPFGCVQGNHHSISVNFVQVFAEAVGGNFTLISSRGKTYAKLTLPLAKKIPQDC